MSQDITGIDFFCGAGGSSTGLKKAGIRVTGAANHWALAIDTHNTNHPDTDHYLDDLQVTHPSRYPRADIAWFSPECTNHSLAKGKKRKNIGQLDLWGENKVDPAEERSRATMREVVEFTAFHHYEIVIVENVVDIRHWQHYDAWLTEMLNLGYNHKVLYLNAQFFGVPQSRDRFYAVFWKKGNRAPNLDFRPPAVCPKHGQIFAVQAWKKAKQWGRYGKRRQYVYRCPQCGDEVMPAFRPASSVIDWSLPSEKIGDRKKELKEKTIQRVLAGLKKFGQWPHVADLAHSHAEHSGKVQSVDMPLSTETGQHRHALINPFLTSYYSREGSQGWPVSELSEPVPTITGDNRHAIVMPPFIATLRGDVEYHQSIGLDEPLTTIVAAGFQHYLVQPPPFIAEMYGKSTVRSVDEPLGAITTMGAHHALVTPPFLASLNHSDIRNNPISEPMPTVMPDAHPALISPPFLIVQRGTGTQDGIATPVGLDEPMRTIATAQGQHVLINPPIIMAYYGNNPIYTTANQPLSTIPAVSHHALITPEDLLPECGFRMLEPHELKRGMSFPDSYIILGNKRDQVRQVGNAVCPDVAEWIGMQCVESLS